MRAAATATARDAGGAWQPKVGDRVRVVGDRGWRRQAKNTGRAATIVADDGPHDEPRYRISFGAGTPDSHRSAADLAPLTFNVGDRVRLNQNYAGWGKKGNVGTVAHVSAAGALAVNYDSGITWFAPAEMLDLLPASAPAVDASTWTGIVAAALERPPLPKQHAVGDKVVWVDPGRLPNHITRGKVYEVVASTSVFAEVIADDGRAHAWYHHRLGPALIPATPTVAAIVIRVGANGLEPATRPYVHESRALAEKEAARLAVIQPGTEFAVFERVSAAVADKPAARMVA